MREEAERKSSTEDDANETEKMREGENTQASSRGARIARIDKTDSPIVLVVGEDDRADVVEIVSPLRLQQGRHILDDDGAKGRLTQAMHSSSQGLDKILNGLTGWTPMERRNEGARNAWKTKGKQTTRLRATEGTWMHVG
eukprot:3275973-Prymnesium_polylepis.1